MAEFKKVEVVVETGNSDVREFKTVTKTVETKESRKARRLAILDRLPSNCDLEKISDSCGNETVFAGMEDYFARFAATLPSGKVAWERDGTYHRIANGRCDMRIDFTDLAKLMNADLAK